MTTKIVSSRDSATATLRKMGISPRDYNLFIEKLADNKFSVSVHRANNHILNLAKPVDEAPNKVVKVVGKPKQKLISDKDKAAIIASAEKLAKQRIAKAESREATKVVKAQKEKSDLPSLQMTIIRAINAGKTNQEIFEQVKISHNLEDRKRFWISWYRSCMKPGKRFAHFAADTSNDAPF
jgi:hypothetical protein